MKKILCKYCDKETGHDIHDNEWVCYSCCVINEDLTDSPKPSDPVKQATSTLIGVLYNEMLNLLYDTRECPECGKAVNLRDRTYSNGIDALDFMRELKRSPLLKGYIGF